jgi:hypothetical protein
MSVSGGRAEVAWTAPEATQLIQQLLGSLAIFSLKDWKPSRFNNAVKDVKRFDLLATEARKRA